MTDRFRVVPAAYVVFRRDRDGNAEVLLQLRRGTGYMDGFWATAAAGHVEADESVLEAACREVTEELGVTVDPGELVPLCAMHRTAGNHDPIDERVDFFFELRSWRGEPGSWRRTRRPSCAGSLWARCRPRSCRTSSSCSSGCAQAASIRSSRSGSEPRRTIPGV